MYWDFVSCTFTPYPFIFHWQFYSYFRDHEFDAHIRVRRNPKRKSMVVSKPNEPARGCMTVRQYHRRDESKIVPHVRRGLQLDNLFS
jgi:hypothetical protein